MAAGAVEVNITTNNSKKGASFDGVDDFIQIPHNTNQLGTNLLNGFTISVWINPKSEGEINTGRIIDKSTGLTGQNGFRFYTDFQEGVSFKLNNGITVSSSASAAPYSKWAHVLVTISSAQICSFFINGVASGTPADLVQGISTIVTTNAARIGNRSGATDSSFDGIIKDLKMWNRVLTASEITDDFAGNNITDGQILNFPLQDDYNDISDTGLTGTNSGTHFANVDDAVAAVIKADRTTANDTFLISQGGGGQVVSAVIEEAP